MMDSRAQRNCERKIKVKESGYSRDHMGMVGDVCRWVWVVYVQ